MARIIPGRLPEWTDALGHADVFLTFQEQLARVADSERPVLILGERGTGKELAAGRIHYLSRRWDKPFVSLLGTALHPNLLEAELFGYEAGAFTGARERRAGYFERADQGTLFLDEVADMPLFVQDKLLRVIEYGVFTRIGGFAEQRTDVRVVAATNRDVRRLTRENRLRPDLLDRLACEVAHVPPLRERGDDILLLARHFADRMAVELGRDLSPGGPDGTDAAGGVRFGDAAVRQLYAHAWPGNVRELKNVVERSLLRGQGGVIDSLVLEPFTPPWAPCPEASDPREDPQGDSPEGPPVTPIVPGGRDVPPLAGLPPGFDLARAVDDFERAAVHAALAQARHRQTEAAKLLGLSYDQFRGLYKKFGSQPPLDKNLRSPI